MRICLRLALATIALMATTSGPVAYPRAPTAAGAAPSAPRAQTGVYEAAVSGDLDTVKKILAEHPKAANEGDEHGFTPLHGLAGEEHLEIAEYIIAHGGRVNAPNDEGVSPLHLAAWPAMARLLIRHGANLEARNRVGETPLLALASEPDREEVMEVLLEAGANVNATDGRGWTALDLATAREEGVTASLLRRHGGLGRQELGKRR